MSDNHDNKKNEQAPILDHDYDGIQEYDNPLPNWWLWTFFGTIIFAFIYYIHYEVSGVGHSLKDELQVRMAEIAAQKVATAPHAEGDSSFEESLATAIGNKDEQEEGRALFVAKCVACHGEQGQGLIGPNLTDNYWINGKGEPSAILKVIRKGVLDKGMPPWENSLKPRETVSLVSYVVSLKGTNPESAKAPQGEEVH